MGKATRGARPLRRAYWAVGALIAAVTLTSSGVALQATGPGLTRVLGTQFTASSASGSTTGNSGCGVGNGGPSGSKNCDNPGHPITVTGTVLGPIYPGASTKLRLQITNPNNQDLRLQSASAVVGTPSNSGCAASWFTVTPYAGSPTVTLRKNAATAFDLTFTMINKPFNQDGCKSASIPLTFNATASQ